MTGNTVSEIFDIKGSLESTREKASEGRCKRGEGCHDEQVQMVRCVRHIWQPKADLRKDCCQRPTKPAAALRLTVRLIVRFKKSGQVYRCH